MRPTRTHLATAGLVLALATVLVAAPALLAQGPDGRGHHRGGERFGHGDGHGMHAGLPLRFLARHLDLTDAQIEETRALVEAFRTEVQPLHDELRVNHQELRALLDTESPDATAVGLLVLETDAARDQLRARREILVSDFAALLTTEQLERFEALQERWQARRDKRGGRGGRGEGPRGGF